MRRGEPDLCHWEPQIITDNSRFSIVFWNTRFELYSEAHGF